MLSENAFEQLPAKIEQRLTAINTEYLEMIGKRIKAIGTVSATDIHRLNQLREFGSDVDVIIKRLADAANKNVDEINRIFEYVAKDGYTDAEIFYKAKKVPYIPYSKNTILRDYVAAIAKQTTNSYKNLSNTTAICFRVKNLQGETVYKGLAETYKEVIDKAIYEASMGLTDYNSAMRSTLKELADSGIRVVDYESGYSRRMDSAVRQNILDGIREVNQGVQQRIGKEIKSDGVEISAHFNPAPDHAPYQGRQYTHKEFQQLNDVLTRRIGTLNCMHYTHEIILGVSQPAYSNKELQDILEKSKVKKMFDGKEYTPYEATQLQRKIETAVRAAKDRAAIAKASGDDLLRRQEQARITQLKNKYKELSDTFDLPVRTERMVALR
jgi:tetrahydromethanopterin S-methyltransferase subunit G